MNPKTMVDVNVEVHNGLYVAHVLPGRMEGWGEGAITTAEHGREDLETLAQAVLDSIKPVTETEQAYSDCTDGRQRTILADGLPVPNREKLTGADALVAFFMAEALGSRFYKNPNASVDRRLEEVFGFLKDNDINPSTHDACGAAAGFVAVAQNAVRFSSNKLYVARQQVLLPHDVYDRELAQEAYDTIQRRLALDAYRGYSPELVMEKVRKFSGLHAIAGIEDDGRGIHGHVEEAIVRFEGLVGVACDVNMLAEMTGGREVFTINDNRRTTLAKLFGRGLFDTDYQIAEIAGEAFIDAGHGTLASKLPTILITAA